MLQENVRNNSLSAKKAKKVQYKNAVSHRLFQPLGWICTHKSNLTVGSPIFIVRMIKKLISSTKLV